MIQKSVHGRSCRVGVRLGLWLPLVYTDDPNVIVGMGLLVHIVIRTWISRWLRWKTVVFDRWCV